MYDITKIWPEWHVKRLIGEGSFGKVYEIYRNKLGIDEHSALKVITIPTSTAEVRTFKNEGMDDNSITAYYSSVVKDFTNEIALMAKLKGSHNVVAYEDYEIYKHEDDFGWDILIRMELLEALPDYMVVHPLDKEKVLDLAIDLCDSLIVCHKNHIIHRDIKLDNIFVTDTGVYKLGDFGVARTIEKTTSGLSKKGTYTYMAPEVYKGESYGAKADIYSLGMVMYRLLNDNREPFVPLPPEIIKFNDKNNALIRRMKGDPLPKPVNADDALSDIILKACSFKAEDRFSSAEEFKSVLQSYKYSALKSQSNQVLEKDKSERLDNIALETNEETTTDEKTVSVFDSFSSEISENKNEGTNTDEATVSACEPNIPAYVDIKENQKNYDNKTSKKKIIIPIIIGIVLSVAIIVIIVLTNNNTNTEPEESNYSNYTENETSNTKREETTKKNNDDKAIVFENYSDAENETSDTKREETTKKNNDDKAIVIENYSDAEKLDAWDNIGKKVEFNNAYVEYDSDFGAYVLCFESFIYVVGDNSSVDISKYDKKTINGKAVIEEQPTEDNGFEVVFSINEISSCN